ncbi:hypothetical protein SAMN02745857_03895 [Andreprevotia lacus DSM 23236]|jgi:SpoVK/Ycf46/Vps4 family AAA+-type ATPase|uniref:Uncharacterized protein n=1 Tax=Andreprevotia lacus DSM 23236 TaxID=1121001 RepID=A0A1W1Y028_9NEIS|nr:hypothetical protein [Andreprevotia lacus]SMC29526.1 hypothetical protein SAMN02745857_03895 [Andreprevotia lacus DSM 23236]
MNPHDLPPELATPGFLSVADRELLIRLFDQLHEYGGQLDRVCNAVMLRGISGFTPAELRMIGNAAGMLADRVDLRLTQDHAARAIAKRTSTLTKKAA